MTLSVMEHSDILCYNEGMKGGVGMQVTASQMKQLTEGRLLRLCRDIFHPALMALARSVLRYRIVVENDYTPLPDRPILFAGNHYCGYDITVACNAIHGRVQIVAGKQPMFPADEFFLKANGTIFVDRLNREDTAACKRVMAARLRAGQNVIIFPEGTSNVSDALPMYPMKWGIIDVAQQTGAQIIPMILRYDKEKRRCHVRFLDPITAEGMTKQEGIRLLRDTMAAARWKDFELGGLHSRAGLDIREERRINMELLLSYKLLDYRAEQSVVFRPYPTEEEVFEPICRAYAKMMGGK